MIDDSWKNGRLMMTRLRSGTNELEIESGRWIGKKIEDRVCRICNSGSVEDEPHMIDVESGEILSIVHMVESTGVRMEVIGSQFCLVM